MKAIARQVTSVFSVPLMLASMPLGPVFVSQAATVPIPSCGNPTTYGVSPGNVDSAQFQALLTSCAAQTIQFAAGTYVFTPNGYAGGFKVPAGTATAPTRIVGNGSSGPQATIFTISSKGSFDNFLSVRNTSNVTIENIDFEGSAYPSGCAHSPPYDYGRAVWIHSDAQASASVETISVTGNVFHNFNASSWLLVDAANQSPGVGMHSEITASNNTFISDGNLAGGCAADPNYGGAWMLSVVGSLYSSNGLVENVFVVANTFESSFVNGGVAIWAGAHRISVRGNTVNNAHRGLPYPMPPNEAKGYAILVYNNAYIVHGHGLPPDTIGVIGNTIVNPVSCGLYTAKAANIDVEQNRISGQTDTYDAVLTKGALSFGSSTNVTASKNNLTNNVFGMEISGGSVTTNFDAITVPSAGIGIKLSMDNTSNWRLQSTAISTAATDGTPTSVIGFGHAAGCAPTCAQSSITNLTQIGWPATSDSPRSLSWYSSDHGQTYHQFADIQNITFSNITRQATPTSQPVAQTAFWP